MPAFIEPCDYVIRFGPEANAYGDDYVGVVCVRRLNENEVEIIGYSPGRDELPADMAHWHRDVLRCLARYGFRSAVRRKIKDGHMVHEHHFDLTHDLRHEERNG